MPPSEIEKLRADNVRLRDALRACIAIIDELDPNAMADDIIDDIKSIAADALAVNLNTA